MAKQIKYRGDRTGSIRAGDVLGPDVHGQHHRVTTVRFEHPYTHVETRRIPTEGQRVRYFGGRGSPQPPNYDDEHLPDEVQAQ
jgi:hypothetical protein